MSDQVKAALIGSARRSNRLYVLVVGLFGAGALLLLALSVEDVGARAPVDQPLLCVSVACALATVLAIMTRRERAALLEQVSADDLVGLTRSRTGGLWLHFRNGGSFLVPKNLVPRGDIASALPSLPRPPRNYPRVATWWGIFVVPVAIGVWLNDAPIPTKIAQLETTRGRLALTGAATLAAETTVVIDNSSEYAVLRLDDGTGTCLIYVETAALSPAQLEQLRGKNGVPMRAIVYPQRVRYKEGRTAEFDARIVVSFELLNRT